MTREDCISRKAVLDTLDTTDKFLDEDRTVENYKALLKECYEVLTPVTPPSEDCVSRQEVLKGYIEVERADGVEIYSEKAVPITYINNLPPVTPTISDIDKFNDSVNRATVLALINDVKNADGFKDYSQYDYLFDQVDKMPMATPFRKKGEWCKQNDDYFDWYECSECGYGSEGEMQYSSECDVRTKYCPNCGAEMEVEE